MFFGHSFKSDTRWWNKSLFLVLVRISTNLQRVWNIFLPENQKELEQCGHRYYDLKVPRISHELEQKRSVFLRTQQHTALHVNKLPETVLYTGLAVFKYEKRLCVRLLFSSISVKDRQVTFRLLLVATGPP